MITHAKPISDTYEEVEKLITKLAYQSLCCPSCDVEERISSANEFFMIAYHSYKPGKGTKFSTWLYHQVRGRLMSECGKCRRRHRKHSYNTEAVDAASDSKRHWMDDIRLTDLSDDAMTVVKVVTESPAEIIEMLEDSNDRKGILRTYLSALGWTMARVTESFAEIKEALR